MQRRLLGHVVVGQGVAILQLLAREDEALLVRGDALLVLDPLLHVLDRVAGLHVQGNGPLRSSHEHMEETWVMEGSGCLGDTVQTLQHIPAHR